MPCYHPLHAFRSREPGINGKHNIAFSGAGESIDLPCGQCIGCRLEKSRQWAIRCVHESQMHEKNSFITLTYNNENLPPTGSVDVKHWQKFMKRLRKNTGLKIRFFHCGEYGDQLGRPHYHACMFGYDPDDKVFYKNTENGDKLYTSESLDQVWSMGNCYLGELNFASAAYTARYIMKKVTGKQALKHYESAINKQTGEISIKTPEYITMSRKPGIGRSWYEKYKKDIYPGDFTVLNGKKIKSPRYYDYLLEQEDPELLINLKQLRKQESKTQLHDQTKARLLVRETVKKAQISSLNRSTH